MSYKHCKKPTNLRTSGYNKTRKGNTCCSQNSLLGILQVFTKQIQDISNWYHILIFIKLFMEIVGSLEISPFQEEIKIKWLVAGKKYSSQYHYSQFYSKRCMHIIIKIFLKVCLVLPFQIQFSKLRRYIWIRRT